jgi:hypothetical protein
MVCNSKGLKFFNLLPLWTPTGKPKYLTLRDVTFVNPALNTTYHRQKSASEIFYFDILNEVLIISAFQLLTMPTRPSRNHISIDTQKEFPYTFLIKKQVLLIERYR